MPAGSVGNAQLIHDLLQAMCACCSVELLPVWSRALTEMQHDVRETQEALQECMDNPATLSGICLSEPRSPQPAVSHCSISSLSSKQYHARAALNISYSVDTPCTLQGFMLLMVPENHGCCTHLNATCMAMDCRGKVTFLNKLLSTCIA